MTEIITTGLTGVIGSRIPELYSQHQFHNLSRSTGVDILKPDTYTSVSVGSAKALIHLAAFTDTAAAFADKGNTGGPCYQVNVVGTRTIIDLCRQHNLHLVHVSTDSVFDGTKTTPYTEADPRQPLLDWYGQTKAMAEELVEASGIPYTIVRVSFPYRATFSPKLDFVRKIISKLKNGETCKLFTDQFTTPTFVDDIATGLMKIVGHPRQGIYHLVGSSSQSLYELGIAVASTFGFSPELIQPSSLAEYLASATNVRPYSARSVLSSEKFIHDYGFTPHNLTSGLEEMKRQITS